MAVKPAEIGAKEAHGTSAVESAAQDALVQAVDDLKRDIKEYTTAVQQREEKLQTAITKFDESATKIQQLSTFFSSKKFAMQDMIVSGATDAITEIAEEARGIIHEVTKEYEEYLRTLTREAQERTNKAFRIRHLTRVGETGKVALIWVLVIAGVLFLLRYLALI